MLFVFRYRRPAGFAILHPGSSVILQTDALGAQALRWLRAGASTSEIADRLQRVDVAAAEHWTLMVNRLSELGALTASKPQRKMSSVLRAVAEHIGDTGFAVLSTLVSISPYPIAQTVYWLFPYTPFGVRTFRQTRYWSIKHLEQARVAVESSKTLADIARRSSAAMTRAYLLWGFSVVMQPSHFERLVRHLAEKSSWTRISTTMAAHGGVVALLHCESYPALVAAMQASGRTVALAADTWTSGIPLASNETFQEEFPLGELVDTRQRTSLRKLLRVLRNGGIVVVPFDAPETASIPVGGRPHVEFLRHSITRFNGAAWLARRADSPLFLGAIVLFDGHLVLNLHQVSEEAMHAADDSTAVETMTNSLYAAAQAFIYDHPEAWLGWCYFDTLEQHR